jgi:hypothetical protein
MVDAIANSDWLVFWIVAGARFLIPLTIPRFPLPGILVSLILDAVDQTIFQQFPGIELEGYQGYDKALDIYYLAIAYISTLRNWENHFAFRVSRFLFYWRLAGVALFELTQLRALLLIFPNTFEYFFIFYEVYRLRWDPIRMSNKFVVGAAAFIWIVIKLPQEYWIHISQTDTTDWIKTNLFRLPVDTPWSYIIQTSPVVCFAGVILIALLIFAVWWLVKNKLPPGDHAMAFSADARQPAFSAQQVGEAVTSEARQIIDAALVEKIVLITLVCLCFAQVLPGVQSSDFQLVIGLAFVVLINTALSHWMARRRFGWAFTMWQSIVLVVVNLPLLMGYALVRNSFGDSVRITNVLFFVVLLTFLVTLYDRYRQVYLIRHRSEQGSLL